jgi:hypothetical protein
MFDEGAGTLLSENLADLIFLKNGSFAFKLFQKAHFFADKDNMKQK